MKKKLLTISVFVISIFLFLNNGIAHSPSSVDIVYNFTQGSLTVTVNHVVPDTSTHYIELIEIFVNDVLNQSQPYTEQTTTSYHQNSFTVLTNHGDVIKIIATCSISGSATKEFTALDPNSTDTTSATSILFAFLALVTGFIILKRRRT